MILRRSLAVLLAATAACGTESTLPDSDADISGTLTTFLQKPASPNDLSRVLVQADAPAPEDQAIISMNVGTVVYIVERGVHRLASRTDLYPGDRLQVWVSDWEMRSYPVQVSAERVHVIR